MDAQRLKASEGRFTFHKRLQTSHTNSHKLTLWFWWSKVNE